MKNFYENVNRCAAFPFLFPPFVVLIDQII